MGAWVGVVGLRDFGLYRDVLLSDGMHGCVALKLQALNTKFRALNFQRVVSLFLCRHLRQEHAFATQVAGLQNVDFTGFAIRA